MSWLATATNELMLPSRSCLDGGERIEVRLGERPERHRQDVELARLDERQEQPERAFPFGDLRPGSPSRGRGPARSGPPARSGRGSRLEASVSWPRRRAAAAPRSRGRAGRPAGGSARPSAASSRPPRRSAPRSPGASEGAPARGRMPGSQAVVLDPRIRALAERVRRRGREAGVALAGVVEQAGEEHLAVASRRRRAALRRRRARGAGRRRASRRRPPAGPA